MHLAGRLSRQIFALTPPTLGGRRAGRKIGRCRFREYRLGEKIMSDSSRDGSAQVEVWSFRRFDLRAGQYVASIGKAEISAIESFGAEAIPGSMECVPQHRLDGNGIYTPPAVAMSPAARRRLERLRAEYTSLLAEEDHGRLDGWSERVESLATIVKQIDEKLALGTSSLVDK
jgi:hypothetical protein